jgi:tetratricopeptide (TPR) repeat protein
VESAELDCVSKDADTAIRGCTVLIRTHKDPVLRAKAHVNRGYAYASKQDDATAIAEYTEAIRLNPSASLAHWNRGKLYQDDGKFEKALPDATRYLELDPGLKAIAWRAHLHRALGKHEEAVADYGVAIGLRSGDASLYADRAASYQALRRFEPAIADLTKALQLDPSATRLHDRAQAHFDQKSYAKAIEDCNAAIMLDAEYDSCFQLRGDAQLQQGNLDAALADATKAIELAKGSLANADDQMQFVTEDITLPYMYALRGEVYERRNERDKAVADYRRTIEKYEDHPRAVDGLKRLGVTMPEKN